MPLMKSGSKKAFSKNVESEMEAGKPKNQSLAIAFSVKRKAKKPQKMAEGGMAKNESAKSEARPMPEERDKDSKSISRNSGNKAPKNDDWTSNVTINQAQSNNGRKVMPIKHPKMVPINGANLRLRDQEDDLQSSASPGPYGAQPQKADDEEGANRQGPNVSDMADEHSTHAAPYIKHIEDQYAQDMASANMKRSQAYASGGMVQSGSPDMNYAKGGQIEASDKDIHLGGKYEDDLLDLPPSEDEGSANARSRNEMGQNRQGPKVSDMEEQHNSGRKPYAKGGHIQYDDAMNNEDHEMELNPAHDKHSADDSEDQPQPEEEIEHQDSIAAAIMAKKDREKAMMSDSDIDEMQRLYNGGEIHSQGSMDSDDSDQADLSRNADEDANEEDQASFNALRKENYSESAGLKQLDSPDDSAQHGDEEEDDSENKHDMISSIRANMNKRRQFKQR